jgi:peptidoglycan/LPS O-acetylase OafA/YrhL
MDLSIVFSGRFQYFEAENRKGLLAFARQVPYVPLRHGLLAPLALLVINDLAHGRGLLGRFLSWPGFGRLAEASFSLFAMQMPAGVWFCVATLATAIGTTAQLVAMIAWTLGLAVIWSELVQRPMIERLRRGKRASSGDTCLLVPETAGRPLKRRTKAASSGLETGAGVS